MIQWLNYMTFNPFEERGTRGREQMNAVERALLERAHKEAALILNSTKIKPEDFKGLYDADRIARDVAYVKEKQLQFEADTDEGRREAKRLAVIFEGIFHKGASEFGWLGEGARVIKTSDVDDIRHGVDGIIEFDREDTGMDHLAIGVDVTYSGQLADKFRKIRADIENGTLPTIEYFRSGNYRGELENVPRVVVGAEQPHIIQLCKDIFLDPKPEQLSRHPFQMLQLRQMRLQLEAFADYAAKLKRGPIEQVYRRDAEIVRKILQQKSVAGGIRLGDWENDRVFAAIQRELETLKGAK
ncbi:MAG: hypothetical protein HY455_01095 [Parcubacteria group bacterium]|nr:hypothetical protein [Parcubacteria group bacterium]